MNIESRLSANKAKTYHRFSWGKQASEKLSSGLFTWTKPKDQIQKNHNKEVEALLQLKLSQLIVERAAVGSGFIPSHKHKQNFFDFYEEFVKNHRRVARRHLECSLKHLRAFVNRKSISPSEITEDLCIRYRTYLLDRFRGETPANYFAEFKRVIRAATKQGYFRTNPAEEVAAKQGKKRQLKSFLEANEYLKLLATRCHNEEVQEAFILCCYTGLRWADVSVLRFSDIGPDTIRTRIIQAKTGEPVIITLHDIPRKFIEKRIGRLRKGGQSSLIFRLPTADGANQILKAWAKEAQIDKNITWSCARLSFAILLQDERVDSATVALLLGHTTTKYVNSTYKRHRPKDHAAIMNFLPRPTPKQDILVLPPPIEKPGGSKDVI